jgi:2-polyprenyl-3-methyl-5-hydroxy-6-metoxy-1,4-benzoquinol methylase
MVSQASTTMLTDLGPDVYAKWRASGIGGITEQLQRRLILTLLGEIRDRSVLDVGCSDGDFALELRRRGASVTGIDASPEMVEAPGRELSEKARTSHSW